MESGSLAIRAVSEIEGEFYVPDYQRGYRWGKTEVCQLLNDITENPGATYYLQPIVVKSREDSTWELVDGQQRLTTLYLIFRQLKRYLPFVDAQYSLQYETRPGSRDYLELLGEDDAEAELLADSNIDFSHMFGAYKSIQRWFEDAGSGITRRATRIHDELTDNVKVLWYVAPPHVDSRRLFTNLNVGRIPLTDAELVKAQLLRNGASNGSTNRAPEMAAHWDSIERDLKRPEVWSFVTGRSEETSTHISLLLDSLASRESRGTQYVFQTFENLRDDISTKDGADEFWSKVVDQHSLVLGWHDDRDLYHKIGYLIAVGRRSRKTNWTFEKLVDLSQDKGRSEFDKALDEAIRAHLSLAEDDLPELTYTNNKNKIEDLLLLMNVETVRDMKHSTEVYSFEAHAAGEWSLEHIHAQNAVSLNKEKQWRTWLEVHRDTLRTLPGVDADYRAELLARIDERLAEQLTQRRFDELERELSAVFSPTDTHGSDQTHLVSNLALLGRADNSALNNSLFEVKRQAILKMDNEGSYIPACTRRVFLKYYTAKGSEQMHFWGPEDRSGYFNELVLRVRPYLKTTRESQ